MVSDSSNYERLEGWCAKYVRYLQEEIEDGFEDAMDAIRYLEVGEEQEHFAPISVISPEGIEYFNPDSKDKLKNGVHTWDEIKHEVVVAQKIKLPDDFFEKHEKFVNAKGAIYEALKGLNLVDQAVVLAEVTHDLANATKRWYDEQNFNAVVEEVLKKDE